MLQTTPVYPNPSGLAVPPAGGTPYAGSPPVSAAPMPNQPLSVLGRPAADRSGAVERSENSAGDRDDYVRSCLRSGGIYCSCYAD